MSTEPGSHLAPVAIERAIALCDEVLNDPSLMDGGTVNDAAVSVLDAALLVLSIGRGQSPVSRLEPAMRTACAALAGALLLEERRFRRVPPPQIVPGLQQQVHGALRASTPFAAPDGAALFLFEQSVKMRRARKGPPKELLSELAVTLSGACRVADVFASEPPRTTSEAVLAAREFIAIDRQPVVDRLLSMSEAIRRGEAHDVEVLVEAAKWQQRLSAIHLEFGHDGALSATLESLGILVDAHEQQNDPRRLWLAELASVTTRAAEEPAGLTDLRRRAQTALDSLDDADLDEAMIASLEAVYELIASNGAPAVVSDRLPAALLLGLPAGLLVPPTVVDLVFGEPVPLPGRHKAETAVEVDPDATALIETEAPAMARADTQQAELPEAATGIENSSPLAEPSSLTDATPNETHPPDPATKRAALIVADAEPADRIVVDATATHDADLVVTKALDAHRFSVAYWAAIAAGDELDQFTVDALHVAALAAGLGDDSTDVAEHLDLALQQTISTEHPLPAELLYAAAAMRLLLVKPFGVAPAVLREATRDLQHLCPPYSTACAFLADRSTSGVLVDVRGSEAARRSADLGGRSAALRARAVEGRDRWPLETQKFHPVNKIWSRWTTGSGELRTLLDLVADGSSDTPRIQAIVDGFVVRKRLDRRIDDAYAQVRPKKADKLVATAREWLYARVDRVLTLANKWLELQREEENTGVGGQTDVVSLRSEFVPLDLEVTAALNDLEQGSPQLRAAVGLARRMWERMRAHVLMEEPLDTPAPSASAALNSDLAAAYELILATDGTLEAPASPGALAILEAVPDRAWLEVFEQRFAQGDHASTKIALGRLGDGVDRDTLRTRRDDDLYARRQRTRERVDQALVRLSRLLVCGALTAVDFERAKKPFDQLPVSELTSFPIVDRQLEELTAQLNGYSAQHRAALETRLQGVAADKLARERLTGLFDEEQYDVADELIGQLSRGETLTSTESDEDLLVEFLGTLEGLTDVDSAIARLDGDGSPEANEVQAAKAAITQLRTMRSTNVKTELLAQRIRLIFTTLGLDVVGGSVKQRRGLPDVNEIELDASPIGASWLPPELGSGVGLDREKSRPGHYTLLIARTTTREKDLVRIVRGHTDKQRAVLVLAVEPLPITRRRALARAAREERVTFLLADAFNLMFQGLRHGSSVGRFDAWLATSLPFAWVNPYVTQGNVPPEMFVGRRTELQTLRDAAGSCFVFGGRQLGKSVLLREVRATAHAPEDGRIGILIDLKMEGIGTRRPVEELWGVVAAHLDEAGVDAGPNIERVGVVARLRAWLDADRARQVMLLLDETDVFLEVEARTRHFENVLALRNLMEETERRFKVVLAGLHSVNRFRRIPNQPLAQFGGTSPIGPLSWSDARYLVEGPMRAAGFRLEPPDLVHRVLVETRRHPSILQFVCRALIDHFGGAAAQRGGGLPVRISAAELDQVFEQEDLQERIRERFEWTLNLDPRYRVIALIMALRSVEDPTVATDGLPARELWEQALAYWERGFVGLARDEFDVLLEEMVNLEVLAQTEQRYRMPSARVLRLLGDEDKILEALEHETHQDPHEAPSPERLRRSLSSPQELERSPLTRGDERQLLEPGDIPIRIVFGTPATNVQRVLDGLEAAVGELAPGSALRRATGPLNFDDLAKKVSATDDATIVIGSWRPSSAEEAAESLRRYLTRLADKGGIAGQTVVAVVDHRSMPLWSDLYEMVELSFTGEARWIALKRWDEEQTRAWLEELEIPHDHQMPRQLAAATGGWPTLLAKVVEVHRRSDRGLEEVTSEIAGDPEQLQALIAGLELHSSDDDRHLDALRLYADALDAGDLATLAEDGDAGEAQQLLDVLWLSQAASLTGDRLMRLEPMVAAALEISPVDP